MATIRTAKKRTVLTGPSDGSTVGKCRNHSFHPRITMRMLCGKMPKASNRPVRF